MRSSISNPTSPRPVGGNRTVNADSVAVSGERIYLATGRTAGIADDGLVILGPYQAPPAFTPPFVLDAAGFHVFLQGTPGQAVRLQRSQDLKTWTDWQTATLTAQPLQLTDPAATSEPFLFYRAVSVP